jgi:hypothetical protein
MMLEELMTARSLPLKSVLQSIVNPYCLFDIVVLTNVLSMAGQSNGTTPAGAMMVGLEVNVEEVAVGEIECEAKEVDEAVLIPVLANTEEVRASDVDAEAGVAEVEEAEMGFDDLGEFWDLAASGDGIVDVDVNVDVENVVETPLVSITDPLGRVIVLVYDAKIAMVE